MKRRNFLQIALAGSVLPAAGRVIAATGPCPPPQFSVQGGAQVSTPCTNTSTGSMPAWFNSLPERQWTAFAGGGGLSGSAWQKGARLADVQPSAYPGGSLFGAVTGVYQGACVLQDTNEFIFPCNGGHGDYAGNEIYACKMDADVPTWERLIDPTPSAQQGENETGANQSGNYSDGRPRSVHGWHRPVAGNGKIVLAGLDGMFGQPSYSSTACYSVDRASLGGGGRAALGYTGGIGPWKYHGIGHASVKGSVDWEGGPAVYDKASKKVWSFAAGTIYLYSFDTQTNAIQSYTVGGYIGFQYAWAVSLPGGYILIASMENAYGDPSKLWVFNTANPSAGYKAAPFSGSPNGAFSAGCGGVYHPGSGKVLVFRGSMTPSIVTLTVPSNPASGTFQFGSLSPAGGSTPPATTSVNQGLYYSKFNIIENMGSGRSALVLTPTVDGSSYVYKLPQTF
jgi:hypothetical protein